MSNPKQRLFSGVLILTCSNLLVKLIGVLFKIPLQSVLTDQGMGYFNAAYTIYLWFYTLSTAGLPVAVSLLVAKYYATGQKKALRTTYRTTMWLLGSVGLLLWAAMLFFAKPLALLIGAPSTSYAIAVIAPTLFFVCLSGGIRGYFQGMGNMMPTALSQVIEAVCKLGLGMMLAISSLRRGDALPVVAAWAVSGLSIGTFFGTLFLIWCRHKKPIVMPTVAQEQIVPSLRNTAKALLAIALPITVSSSVMSVTGLVDVGVVIRRLRSAGMAEAAAVALYGNYTTLAVPMFHLPPTLVTPIACAIIPPLTAARERNDTAEQRRLRHLCLRITMLLLLPCAVGLSVFAHPVLSLLFARPAVDLAAPLLSVLALSIPFVGLLAVTNSLLQVYHHEKKPIVSMIVGAAVKVVASFVLVGIPTVGIFGAPISTLLCYGSIAILNLIAIRRYVGDFGAPSNLLYKPFFACLGCATVATFCRYGLIFVVGEHIATLLALAVAACSYFALLARLGGISVQDLETVVGKTRLQRLPWMERILRSCRRYQEKRMQKKKEI